MAKILLVDDDESLLAVFTTALQKDGFETVTASSGAGGIEKASSEKPDLILLDQVLPDISGNEVLIKLKSQEDTKNIPIIILSNFSQEELVKQAINEGALDYVFKYQAATADVVQKVKTALQEK
ncbi:MAG: response regulator [Candidatus Levyibacteriota bacterium]